LDQVEAYQQAVSNKQITAKAGEMPVLEAERFQREAAAPPTEPPTAPPAPEKPPVQAETGISTERLQATYGNDAVLITKGKGPQAWQAIGEADKRDPYAVLSEARARGIATPRDSAKLRNEHQKLLSAARDAYGTDRYAELAQQAVDFANGMKTVAHGPASDVMRSLQDADRPAYDSPADFDNIIRERMNREASPEEAATFTKAADEMRNGNGEVSKAASDAQKRLDRYKPQEKMSFEDAANDIKRQIKELTKDCNL
jgi:hypothetical protein